MYKYVILHVYMYNVYLYGDVYVYVHVPLCVHQLTTETPPNDHYLMERQTITNVQYIHVYYMYICMYVNISGQLIVTLLSTN